MARLGTATIQQYNNDIDLGSPAPSSLAAAGTCSSMAAHHHPPCLVINELWQAGIVHQRATPILFVDFRVMQFIATQQLTRGRGGGGGSGRGRR